MWIKAAVTKEKGAPFTLEDVELEPCQSDEIQVKIRAVGICHTDEAAQMQQLPVPLPAVLGHEGAGVVEAVGASVTEFKPGDHVVLSYASISWASCRMAPGATPGMGSSWAPSSPSPRLRPKRWSRREMR